MKRRVWNIQLWAWISEKEKRKKFCQAKSDKEQFWKENIRKKDNTEKNNLEKDKSKEGKSKTDNSEKETSEKYKSEKEHLNNDVSGK